jgi:CheY-like chemotaxis protein
MAMAAPRQLVLVIDDDEAARDLMRAYLEDQYEIIETGEPEQALKMTLEHKPSAILLDLTMPGFTGSSYARLFLLSALPSKFPSSSSAARIQETRPSVKASARPTTSRNRLMQTN